jgi:hypothetical protein
MVLDTLQKNKIYYIHYTIYKNLHKRKNHINIDKTTKLREERNMGKGYMTFYLAMISWI